ncbi:MAG: hypothetical protein A3G38_01760 [Omnitrophica WOR_2 bacterium RIFCSPLOWO2_12_FULL_51_8]|nr:MAG: hypothetical protein A3G38_01760 [Omnitrophica WOR_2 bacterium RIFCSPLOWO2_12_FULL_51_8]
MQRILTKREKIIVCLAGTVIIGSGIFKILDWTVFSKNEELDSQVNFNKLKLAKYQRLRAQKQKIMEKYSKFAGDERASGRQKENLVEILKELENLAQEAGVKIIDIRPQTGNKGSALYRESTVDVSLEGEMEGYLRFIYNLENSLSLLRVKKFQFSAKPNSQMLEGAFSICQISPSDR